MNKKFIKLTSAVLALTCVFSATACNRNDNQGGYVEPPAINIRPEVTFTDGAFVENGRSQYQIVLPANYHAKEMNAANEFNTLFSMSTGFELPIITDDMVDYNTTDKFISLGQTEYLEKFNVKPDYAELSTQGYVVKRIDNCVVISGATKDGFGTIYGVYDFLARQIDYECYAEDEVYVKEITDVNLVDVNIKDKPDIANALRCGGCYSGNIDFQNRHRFVGNADLFKGNMTMFHSSFHFMPPEKYKSTHSDWYSTNGKQICYTARGNQVEYEALIEELFQVFLKEIEKTPEINHIGFSMEDEVGEICGCDRCKNLKSYFGGSYAAIIVNFMNDLSDKFENYYEQIGVEKELNFMFFSYKETFNPPSKNIEEATCKDNVYPFICTFNANRVASFDSKENAALQSALEGWSKVCKKMAFWTYSANYNNYIFPHDPFNCLQDNLKYLKKFNPVYYKNEGVGDNYNTTGFIQLKYYLESKLAWNTELNMEALIKDYFVHYFKDASDIMYEFFTRYRLALARMYNEYGWTHYDNSNFSAKNLSFGELRVWQDYINRAYGAIEYLKETDVETYNKLYKRIALESITVDYTIMYLYRGKFLSEKEKTETRERLKANSILTNLIWADDYGNRFVDVVDNLK